MSTTQTYSIGKLQFLARLGQHMVAAILKLTYDFQEIIPFLLQVLDF